MIQDGQDGAGGGAVATPCGVIAGRGMPGGLRPAGLALSGSGAEDGQFRIVVSGEAPEGAALLTLGPYGYDEVVAVWRRLAAASGLPLMVPRPDGCLEAAYPQIGRLVVGAAIDRRRLAVLSGRRPRFLTRRKPARLSGRPTIHRERELATGRGR